MVVNPGEVLAHACLSVKVTMPLDAGQTKPSPRDKSNRSRERTCQYYPETPSRSFESFYRHHSTPMPQPLLCNPRRAERSVLLFEIVGRQRTPRVFPSSG